MKIITLCSAVALFAVSAGAALAQTGASPADPQNDRNQIPAPSNTEPADPAAGSRPAARVPTAPVDRREAERQPGGATGVGAGEGGTDLPPPPPAPAP
jgi:hypothetical protein